MNIDEHMHLFAKSFVLASRRERWIELLIRRNKSTFNNSAKLVQALDHKRCLLLNDRSDINNFDGGMVGLYYDFYSPPDLRTFGEVIQLSLGVDALFSITPGIFAFHFTHEGACYVCRATA